MNYCPNCGKPVLEDEKYCSNCGNSLHNGMILQRSSVNRDDETAEDYQVAEMMQTNAHNTGSTFQTKRKASKLSIVAFICSLTLILSPIGVIMAIIDLCKNQDKKPSFSIAALIIGGLVIYSFFSSSESSSTSNKSQVEYESRDQYVSSCISVNYEDVAREPDSYRGKRIEVSGKVVQVSEGYSNSVTLRVASSKNSYDDIWYVTYKRDSDEARILEDDAVILYGECDGVKTYKTILGASITIPSIKAKYITITNERNK